MAPTIEQIMTGFETALDTIPDFRAANYASGSINPPCAFPLVPSFEYRKTFGRGTYTLPFRIAVLVSSSLDRAGQHKLAGYVGQTGDNSIRAALELDKTLGGIVQDLYVDDFNSQGLQEVGLINYFGGVINVRVMASGV
ncbi:MAG TPA: hypothetical protein VFR23_20210 [Jiangellaceae bacterium]|nr:hypothetical protein [Jiangellaceae bacterium]